MIPLRFGEVAEIVGGRLADVPDPDAILRAPASADSREVVAGGLFACILGARADGHDFVSQAVRRGAVLMLSTRAVGAPAIVVPNVVEALGALANHVLSQLHDLRVVAVTGSSGKTTTKDLIARVAALAGPTIAPVGSLNTEVGLPLTVLRADHDSRVLVLEMGARGVGHIAYLCGIAMPDIGVILNIGSAHVGEFGSVEAIAKSKGELIEALPSDGTAVLNGDDPLVSAMSARTSAAIVRYGLSGDVDVRAVHVVQAAGRRQFELRTPEGSAQVTLRLVGAFQVSNALAAAAVGRALGLSVTSVADALSEAQPVSRWRMEIDDRSDGTTIINDAYNANPESVRAALEALVEVAGERPTWAVLGEMKELGDGARSAHESIGRRVAELGIFRLVLLGEATRPILEGAVMEGLPRECVRLVDDADAAVRLLEREVSAGDVVLIKASRALGLETVARALLEQTPEGGAAP